jgi:hypothetical protein
MNFDEKLLEVAEKEGEGGGKLCVSEIKLLLSCHKNFLSYL